MSDGESTLITGIGELVTNDGVANGGEPGAFAAMSDAALVIAEGKVAWTGPAARAPAADTVVDAAGRAVLPGFADSHAHLVFAGERSAEFAARMAGRPYAAGGILTTVAATRAASDAALRANLRRLADMIALCARVVAIEFVVAAQALDLRAPGQLGLGTGRAYRMIRELVPFTQSDGTLPADLEPLVELVTRGTLTPAA